MHIAQAVIAEYHQRYWVGHNIYDLGPIGYVFLLLF